MSIKSPNKPFDRLLTCRQAADLLSIAPSTLYDYAKRNEVPHVVIRRGTRKRTIRFDHQVLSQWLQKGQIQPLGFRQKI